MSQLACATRTAQQQQRLPRTATLLWTLVFGQQISNMIVNMMISMIIKSGGLARRFRVSDPGRLRTHRWHCCPRHEVAMRSRRHQPHTKSGMPLPQLHQIGDALPGGALTPNRGCPGPSWCTAQWAALRHCCKCRTTPGAAPRSRSSPSEAGGTNDVVYPSARQATTTP